MKDEEFWKLENPTLGTEFEINDHRAVVGGVARVTSSGLFGMPTLYTTFNRAIQYIPSMRYTISYILVEPKDDAVGHSAIWSTLAPTFAAAVTTRTVRLFAAVTREAGWPSAVLASTLSVDEASREPVIPNSPLE